ncbi:MAG: hypothetical protein LBG44_03470 [Gemmatimonadota bacterium]|nr:hypothetical protein [Gemmatimonadota bacterium]
MRKRIGIAIDPDRLRAVGVQGDQAIWAAEAEWTEGVEIGTLLRELLEQAPGRGWGRAPLCVALGPSISQLRRLTGLPPLLSPEILAKMVQEGEKRFFLRAGGPVRVTGVTRVADGEVWAAAVDDTILREVERACRALPSRLARISPAAVAILRAIRADEVSWTGGGIRVQITRSGDQLHEVRRFRVPESATDSVAGQDADPADLSAEHNAESEREKGRQEGDHTPGLAALPDPGAGHSSARPSLQPVEQLSVRRADEVENGPGSSVGKDGSSPGEIPRGLAGLGARAWRFADAYGAAMLSPRDPFVLRAGGGSGAPVPRWRLVVAASAAAFAIGAASFPATLGAWQAGRTAERQLAALDAERREAAIVASDLEQTTEALDRIARFHGSRFIATELLGSFASALPESTAVVLLRVDSLGGNLVALGPSAGRLMQAIERMPVITSLEVAGPVTRELAGDQMMDRVSLRFRLAADPEAVVAPGNVPGGNLPGGRAPDGSAGGAASDERLR